MRRFPLIIGILVGLLTGVVVIVLTYLGSNYVRLPFVPFDLFEFTIRVLPGAVVNFGLGTMIQILTVLRMGPLDQTAKLAEMALAIAEFLALSTVGGVVIAFFNERTRPSHRPLVVSTVAGVLFMLAFLIETFPGVKAGTIIVDAIWLAFVYGVWGLTVGWILHKTAPAGIITHEDVEHTRVDQTRRNILYLGGMAVVAAAASAIGITEALDASHQAAAEAQKSAAGTRTGALPAAQATTTATPAPTPVVLPTSSGPAASPSQVVLQARIKPAPGTRPEITANKDFYRVDINLLPPSVDASTWKLTLNGLVQKPITLTLDQIRARPSFSQYITLECISNPLGGDLISTTLYTGIRLKDLLQEAGLKPAAKALAIQAVDGFYESVPMVDMMDERTLLVYEMNGEPLAVEHGFPLRIYIPNRYGMKQPKWITSMEVLDHDGSGYWVDRGWSAQAIPQTTSVIDGDTTASVNQTSHMMSFGGIAYAGARGISKVEVQVDSHPWEVAQLRIPPLSQLTWVQWRYDWPVQPGDHQLSVRAYDGHGKMQNVQMNPEFPDGATGIFSWAFKV